MLGGLRDVALFHLILSRYFGLIALEGIDFSPELLIDALKISHHKLEKSNIRNN